MNQELADRIRRCEALPAIPAVVVEVLRVTSDTISDAAKVAQVVSSDPALAARTLRTINSGDYGLTQPAGSLMQAIMLAGMRTVKMVVLGLSLSDHVGGAASDRLDLGAFRRRSVYSAVAARGLSRLTGSARIDACFLSSMLMDAGLVALDRVLGGDYARLVQAAPSHRALAEAEQKALGLTHADASGILADNWRLPPVVRDPMVTHHRRPDGGAKGPDGVPLTWLAGRCADVFMEADPLEALADVRRECAGRYGIGEGKCDEFLAAVGKAGTELSATLGQAPARAAAPGAPGEAANPGRRAVDQAADKGANGAENRRAPRASKRGSISIVPFLDGADEPAGEAIRIGFRDLSRNGIGLTSPMAMKVGSRFLVNLPRQGGDEVPIIYTVVRSIPRAGGFDIGARISAVQR